MMHQSYRHRGGTKGRGLGNAAFTFLALGIGGAAVYYAIGWFRTSNAETRAEQASVIAEEANANTTPVILDGSVPMLRPDGTTAGTLYRRGTSEVGEYNTVLTLGALPENHSYEVWMVKDGLADVVSRGAMTVRADGTFAVTFSQRDPVAYPTIVIMLEPNDGVTTPSGTIAAQGVFE